MKSSYDQRGRRPHANGVACYPFRLVLWSLIDQGWTVPLLSAWCGLPPKTLYRVIQGEVQWVQKRTAEKLVHLATLLPNERRPR